VVIAVAFVSGCVNPVVDSWSGETVDDAVITYQGKTYGIAALRAMNIPRGTYEVTIGSPNHHSIETTIALGSGDVAQIQLVPYRRIYSPFVVDAALCRAVDMLGAPIEPRWNYNSLDAQVVAWVMWNMTDSNLHYPVIRWYRPDGALYREVSLPPFTRAYGIAPPVTAPSLPLQQTPGWGVAPPAAIPGIWIVEVLLDGTRAVKMSFSI